MGIIRLMDFLKKNYPNAIKSAYADSLKDNIVAIDASSSIYQFLVKTISKTFFILAFSKYEVNTPMDAIGNKTGHLLGILYRNLLCF
jgi:hypothetical protein